MTHFPTLLFPRIAAVVALALAALSLLTTTLVTDHVTVVSAFPIAQAQFAR